MGGREGHRQPQFISPIDAVAQPMPLIPAATRSNNRQSEQRPRLPGRQGKTEQAGAGHATSTRCALWGACVWRVWYDKHAPHPHARAVRCKPSMYKSSTPRILQQKSKLRRQEVACAGSWAVRNKEGRCECRECSAATAEEAVRKARRHTDRQTGRVCCIAKRCWEHAQRQARSAVPSVQQHTPGCAAA
jgi:hypothetical protein